MGLFHFVAPRSYSGGRHGLVPLRCTAPLLHLLCFSREGRMENLKFMAKNSEMALYCQKYMGKWGKKASSLFYVLLVNGCA